MTRSPFLDLAFSSSLYLALVAGSAGLEPQPPPRIEVPSVPTLSLTLRQALEQARAAAPALARQRALQNAAEAALRSARDQRLPQVDLTAGYTRNSNVEELTLALPGEELRTIFPNLPNSYRTRAALSLPLYTGGRIEDSIRAADRNLEAAGKDLEAQTADLVLETAFAYWDLVTERETERVLRGALESYEAHLVDARNREQFGLAARNEVLAVQVESDRAELRRLEAENAAAVAHANLVRLLGLPPAARIEPAEPIAAAIGEPDELEKMVQDALRQRPERAALEARVEAAQAAVGVAGAAQRPQLGAEAGYDYANPNRKELPLTGEWKGTWDASVNLAWTVFDSGRTAAEVDRARAELEAVRQQLVDLDQRLRLEVTSRSLELGSARQTVEVAERNLAAAGENRKVAADRYREGVIPSSELLDAEVALLQAGLDQTRAWTRLHLAQASLERAVGG
jgi:outer membrane protein TolC